MLLLNFRNRKSQLAIECAHRKVDASPLWVFWLHASDAAQFERDVRNVVEELQVKQASTDSCQFALLERWLRDPGHGKWLIVIDNADNPDVLLDPPSTSKNVRTFFSRNSSARRRIDFLPASKNGSILIPSRYRRAVRGFVDAHSIITVSKMEPAQAMELLKRKLYIGPKSTDRIAYGPRDEERVRVLVDELDSLPLAMTQAASCITSRAPETRSSGSVRSLIQRYLEELKLNQASSIRSLTQEQDDPHRPSEAANALLSTWEISYNYIRQTRPSAAQLLAMMSLCDRHSIPKTLLRGKVSDAEKRREQEEREMLRRAMEMEKREVAPGYNYDRGIPVSSQSTIQNRGPSRIDDSGLDRDIEMLKDFSLVAVNIDLDSFSMHRLVQKTTKFWLSRAGELDKTQDVFINKLCAVFPEGNFTNWATCKNLFSHAQASMLLDLKNRKSVSLKRASVMRRSAWYAWEKGLHTDAGSMAMLSWQCRERFRGRSDKSTLDSMEMAALVNSSLGAWEEAERQHRTVTDERRKKLGDAHADTLLSMTNLALTFVNLGRLHEAEDLQRHVFEAYKAAGKGESEKGIMSEAHLASTCRRQGRTTEALRHDEGVLNARVASLGRNHPDTLRARCSLALTYCHQDKLTKAKDLQSQAKDKMTTLLGERHPDVLGVTSDLSWTLWRLGQTREAYNLLESCVSLSEQVLGPTHGDTSYRRDLLAHWARRR